MPDPDGRPWWDKPPSVDYGGGTPEEQDTQAVAQHAIDAAMASIGGGDTRKWAEPTPEKRGFLAPLMLEKGFHDPTPAVPEILHGPYRAFSEMYQLLATGSQPSDPEVVKRATEVAGLVIGTGGGGEGASAGAGLGGKIVKMFGKKPKETLESLGIDKDFQQGVKDMGLSVHLDYDGNIMLTGKGAIDGSSTHQSYKFGKDTAALEEHMLKLETKQDEWKQALADDLKAPYEKMSPTEQHTQHTPKKQEIGTIHGYPIASDKDGYYLDIGGGKFYGPHPTKKDLLFEADKVIGPKSGIDPSGINQAIHDAVQKGKQSGPVDPYQTKNILVQFDSREEALSAYDTMSKAKGVDKGFKTPEAYEKFIQKEVFKMTDAQDKPTGKWGAYNVFENPKDALPKSGKPDYGDIPWTAQIKINDQGMTWHDFISYNKDHSEIVDLVKQAHASGVGHIMWGGGATPEITIKVPPSGKPPAGAATKAVRSQDIPTEMEMSRWPKAKVIDRILLDEAHPGPIIAYHGTKADNFINFDLSKSQDVGIHFGTKEQAGNRAYPGMHTPTSRIIPAHIDVKNPLELPDLGGWHPEKLAKAIQEAVGVDKSKDIYNRTHEMLMRDMTPKGTAKVYESIRNTLGKMGYDSIRYLNTVEGKGWSYIVWKKGMVKSATSPDHILYAGGPGPVPKDRYAEDQDGRNAD